MNLAEIKAAIPKLSPREQAELDLWLQEREEEATRRILFVELKRKLDESYAAGAEGRLSEWSERTSDDIIQEAREERAARKV